MALLQPSIGTTLKILVHFEVDGLTMDDCDFTCDFYGRYENKKVTLKKDELLRVDENNYIAIVDSKAIGTGNIMCKLSVNVPDADCPDGIRKEVGRTLTNINIVD